MPYPYFDREKLHRKPLSQRKDRVCIEADGITPGDRPAQLPEPAQFAVEELMERLRQARAQGRSRMLVFGAHMIKNGLAPVVIPLIENGWFTHLATNGAGIIHDWELAYQGSTSEHVAENVACGEFGAWEETGFYLNLALVVGAHQGLGYGESIGAMIHNEGLQIPSREQLHAAVQESLSDDPSAAAAAADLMAALDKTSTQTGWLDIPHPHKQFSLQAEAYRLGLPFTGHPMIGHDILYTHPLNSCAAVGRTAERDFLTFAHGVSNIDGGVYLSVGSAVMSPMIFEKSISMAQNQALQQDRRIENHYMMIVDLAKSHWDWTQGEPPEDNPDYYLRYNKTFSRMGGTMRYIQMDNRDLMLTLLHGLTEGE